MKKNKKSSGESTAWGKPKKKLSGKVKILIITLAILVAVVGIAGGVLGFMFCGGEHMHSMERISARRAATCTAEGNTGCYYCADCGKYFTDMSGATELASPEESVIPALGHNIAYVEATAATCTADGEIAHWYCPRCETAFEDEEATTEIAAEDLVVPATGHTEDGGEITSSPTCTADGVRTYTCTVCSVIVRTEVMPALNHDYSVTKADVMQHWTECSRCGDEEEDSRRYHDYISSYDTETCSCGTEITYSQGLAFTYSAESDGYMLSGMGECTDGQMFIPSTYDDGTNGIKPVIGIEDGAFSYGADGVIFVRLPESLAFIGERSFFMCTSLSMIILPPGLTEIAGNAFYGCSSLENLVIPASVSHIGAYAFEQCNAEITFEDPSGWTLSDGTPTADPAAALREGEELFKSAV